MPGTQLTFFEAEFAIGPVFGVLVFANSGLLNMFIHPGTLVEPCDCTRPYGEPLGPHWKHRVSTLSVSPCVRLQRSIHVPAAPLQSSVLYARRPFLSSACPSLLLQVPLRKILMASMMQSEWQAFCSVALRDDMRPDLTPMPSTPSSAFLADWGCTPFVQ